MSLTEHHKKEIIDFISPMLHSKDQAQDGMIRTLDKCLKEFNETFRKHAEEDAKSFGELRETMNDIRGFMQELRPLVDIFKGVGLLRKPTLWILAFILGLVALTGGLKSLLAGILAWLGR